MGLTARHVVIGAGALGSAAAYRLTRRGVPGVVVLEQFALGHDRGASEDHSRIIRRTYHSEAYAPLTQPMFDAWSEVEEECGLQLVTTTGGLDLAVAGTPGAAELDNYRRTLLATPGVGYEDLTAAEVRRRWPQWRIPDEAVGLFQADAGILDIRRATAAHIALARRRGADFRPNTVVTGLTPYESHVVVHTGSDDIAADSVTICAASWTEKLLPSLGLDWRIALSQEQVSYFATPNVREFVPERFPVWAWHGNDLMYGFPVYGEVAVKLGRDMTGRWITSDTRSYEPSADETERLRVFLSERLPAALGPELVSKTCVYDMPADRDFVIDTVPGHPRIAIAIGAGHAGKFAALIGDILAEFAVDGTSRRPIEAFRADRPALADPDFQPTFRLSGPGPASRADTATADRS